MVDLYVKNFRWSVLFLTVYIPSTPKYVFPPCVPTLPFQNENLKVPTANVLCWEVTEPVHSGDNPQQRYTPHTSTEKIALKQGNRHPRARRRVGCPRELTTEHLTVASHQLQEPLRGSASFQLQKPLKMAKKPNFLPSALFYVALAPRVLEHLFGAWTALISLRKGQNAHFSNFRAS